MGVCVASPREGETARLKGAGWGEGFQRSQGSRRLPGQKQAPTVPGLVKPRSCPQSGSLPRGQPTAAFEGEGEGEQNHPETEPQLVWEWGFR